MVGLFKTFKESRRKATAERKKKIRKFVERKTMELGAAAGDPIRVARAAGKGTKRVIRTAKKTGRAGRKIARETPRAARGFSDVFAPAPRREGRRPAKRKDIVVVIKQEQQRVEERRRRNIFDL